MSDSLTKYIVDGVNFEPLYNRNERRVIKALKQILEEKDLTLTVKDIQDVYALSLNNLPAHYAHRGTIILRANVSREDLLDVVRTSLEQVQRVSKS